MCFEGEALGTMRNNKDKSPSMEGVGWSGKPSRRSEGKNGERGLQAEGVKCIKFPGWKGE